MNCCGKFACVLALSILVAVSFSGCITKSQTRMDEHQAYLEGEQAGEQMAQQNPSPGTRTNVVVLGDVQNHEVPWVDGLTLAQAIATAGYAGLHDPKEIILRRDGQEGRINAKDLLHGGDVPLKPGDIIIVNER